MMQVEWSGFRDHGERYFGRLRVRVLTLLREGLVEGLVLVKSVKVQRVCSLACVNNDLACILKDKDTSESKPEERILGERCVRRRQMRSCPNLAAAVTKAALRRPKSAFTSLGVTGQRCFTTSERPTQIGGLERTDSVRSLLVFELSLRPPR
ncbi:hypothetical protein TNCV_3416681 [Trichonephila clavipes]|nr:hypothetical protein TNCV_3416681 [Trichonephila clavipes]